MGSLSDEPLASLVRRIAREHGVRTCVETGTAHGTSAFFAASLFDRVITIDRNAEFRRSGEITIELLPTIPPPPLLPANPNSPLSPFGAEIFIETGTSVSGSNIPGQASHIQWLPNGLFTIATSTVNDTGVDLTVTLEVYDRSWTIAQRVLRNPYNFPATSHGYFADEIQRLLNMVWMEQQGVQPLQYNIVPTSAKVPQASYDQGSDPWQAALDMATAVGYELYFNQAGIVVGKPIPNPFATKPIWNFTDDAVIVQGISGTGSTGFLGDAYSTPIEVSVVQTRNGIYNNIIVQGTGNANAAVYNGNGLETTPQPLLAAAADTNPNSATYIGGTMGNVPNFVQSSLVTKAGAQNMAKNDLQVALSSAWVCTLGIAPNPIFDVDNVVTVTRPRVGLNNANMVLDTITQVFNYADMQMMTGRILSNTGYSGSVSL
jgi:hypothetical protein